MSVVIAVNIYLLLNVPTLLLLENICIGTNSYDATVYCCKIQD